FLSAPSATARRSTGVPAHDADFTGAGKPAARSPATGFPSNAGSAGKPRTRQRVGTTSKTVALPRVFDGATAGPVAARIPGDSCHRYALVVWREECAAG